MLATINKAKNRNTSEKTLIDCSFSIVFFFLCVYSTHSLWSKFVYYSLLYSLNRAVKRVNKIKLNRVDENDITFTEMTISNRYRWCDVSKSLQLSQILSFKHYDSMQLCDIMNRTKLRARFLIAFSPVYVIHTERKLFDRTNINNFGR